jgi:hypothetical protein
MQKMVQYEQEDEEDYEIVEGEEEPTPLLDLFLSSIRIPKEFLGIDFVKGSSFTGYVTNKNIV